ncbi:hypothetical protein KAR91_58680 [Candidatus Pacearchaeota archaeon]|nr:hypothetical protein [Candidatus Pacearchaeota archaeon]
MTAPINLDDSAIHINRAGVAQNKLAELTVRDAKKLVEPHIKTVRKNILSQLKQREIDRKKNKAGSQAVYYKLKEIDQVIKNDWPDITKSVRSTAAKDISIGAKRGFSVVNSELGTAYRTPLVSAAFAESVDLIVKTAAKVHIKVIRAEIVQGMIANDDFARSASRIAQFFDKGKGTGTYKSPFSNAARVIRTETQLAHSRAKVALYENEGFTRVLIVNGKVGCPICAPHIGEIYWLDEGPLPVFHPHCGCAPVSHDRKVRPGSKSRDFEKIPESNPVPVDRETQFQEEPKK